MNRLQPSGPEIEHPGNIRKSLNATSTAKIISSSWNRCISIDYDVDDNKDDDRDDDHDDDDNKDDDNHRIFIKKQIIHNNIKWIYDLFQDDLEIMLC